MRDSGEDFSAWLWSFVDGAPIQNRPAALADVPTQTPASVAMAKALKARGFNFCGPVIVYAFMQATGMVNDHVQTCFRCDAVSAIPRPMMATTARAMPTLALETICARGLRRWPVCGVDEAGRGPWAGPVSAAAVILNPADLPPGIDDSKALTAARASAAGDRDQDPRPGLGRRFRLGGGDRRSEHPARHRPGHVPGDRRRWRSRRGRPWSTATTASNCPAM